MMRPLEQRRYLVVGGTGMLAPLCRTIPDDDLILAARFVSNAAHVRSLAPNIGRMELDYLDEDSYATFLVRAASWKGLRYCIVWVHSCGHAFSERLIETVAQHRNPPLVVHVFGSGKPPDRLAEVARTSGVTFAPVCLGRVETLTGWRWLTNEEISAQTAEMLPEITFPLPWTRR